MKTLFKNANVYIAGKFEKQSMLLDGAVLSVFCDNENSVDSIIDGGVAIFPGFCDVHVHFREPGFSYKERIATGSAAAAHGGYTAVCTMPNLLPPPDSVEHLEQQLKIIERDAKIAVIPYGTITVAEMGEELSDMAGMSDKVVAFSDDGRGVQNDSLMVAAMEKAKGLNKMIVAHCEDNSLLNGGYIHDGKYAREHGHRGICSASEYKQIERDLKLAEKIGVSYHVCHISTKESVELIREAKARGVDVTCETAPHYLTLDESAMRENARFKMNPPLRESEDREALVRGVIDGTVDMIATDHAPHSKEEKDRGLALSPMGVVGLESAFSVLYTYLVRPGVITLEKLVELLSENPRRRFSIDTDPGFTIFKLDEEYEINPDEFLSMGHSTPYEGVRVFGKCLATVYNGNAVYLDSSIKNVNNVTEEI